MKCPKLHTVTSWDQPFNLGLWEIVNTQILTPTRTVQLSYSSLRATLRPFQWLPFTVSLEICPVWKIESQLPVHFYDVNPGFHVSMKFPVFPSRYNALLQPTQNSQSLFGSFWEREVKH